MAVEEPARKQPAMVRDYWPRFHKYALVLTVLTQIIVTLAIGCALIFTGVTDASAAFWITLIAIFAACIGLNILLVNQLLTPLRDLTSALTHISSEPSLTTPPNPNARHFERDGFKPLLQLIYEMAADNKEGDVVTISTDKPVVDFAAALDNTAAGFMIINTKQDVLFANSKAPVHTDPDGRQIIDLIFDDEISLESWLKDCEEHAVHADHTWMRVANKITGEDGRKIYDITASYQKGSEAEVVVTLLDRSGEYQPEDDDLDFIAFAAHELRGPITVIRGYLDVLGDELEDKLDSEQVELLKPATSITSSTPHATTAAT
jgi:signal transduction histidine kinase